MSIGQHEIRPYDCPDPGSGLTARTRLDPYDGIGSVLDGRRPTCDDEDRENGEQTSPTAVLHGGTTTSKLTRRRFPE